MDKMVGTTILCVRRENKVVMGGDGQVTFGDRVIKANAKKIRRFYNNHILAGFAGVVADAIALFERFERKIEEYAGNIQRASVELAKEWRLDKALRKLEAMLLVADKNKVFLLSGNGDIIEPDEDVIAIGSGSGYAYASAYSLLKWTKLSAKEIVKEALNIAGNICIYTNHSIVIEEI